jgi:hypothetical protein
MVASPHAGTDSCHFLDAVRLLPRLILWRAFTLSNCTPITPGQYATCSLLPSTITLSGAAQNATATITTVNPNTTAHTRGRKINQSLLCLLPAALLFLVPNRRGRKPPTHLLLAVILTAATILVTGCGSGGDTSIRKTPPGTYQYKVTASSTNGVQLTQTVTLNLTVTAQ